MEEEATGGQGEALEGETEAPEATEPELAPAGTGRKPELAEELGMERAIQEELESEAEVADLLARQIEEFRDRHLRLAAEFDNYRKRTRQELLKTGELGQAALAGRLLDALDDLRRIAETPADATTVEALHEGVALVEKKIMKELSEAGLEPIDAEGQPFDPNLHEALSATVTDDPSEDEQVSRMFVRGYRFRGRLLRPARVEVKKYAPEEIGSSEVDEG